MTYHRSPVIWWSKYCVCQTLFTSIPLAENLLTTHTTIVGTLRRNKGEIPLEMLPARNRAEKSSLFGFADKLTISSYVPKKGKAVLTLSTMHHDDSTEGDAQKPSIILHYNAKKSGVDNMDHLATMLSCKRKSNRWPMVLFYNMLDVAGVAGFVIWMSLHPEWEARDKCRRRRTYLSQVSRTLTEAWINIRLQNLHILQPSVVNALRLIGRVVDPIQRPRPAGPVVRKRCQLCSRHEDTKTYLACGRCARPVCSRHSRTATTCIQCEP